MTLVDNLIARLEGRLLLGISENDWVLFHDAKCALVAQSKDIKRLREVILGSPF